MQAESPDGKKQAIIFVSMRTHVSGINAYKSQCFVSIHVTDCFLHNQPVHQLTLNKVHKNICSLDLHLSRTFGRKSMFMRRCARWNWCTCTVFKVWYLASPLARRRCCSSLSIQSDTTSPRSVLCAQYPYAAVTETAQGHLLVIVDDSPAYLQYHLAEPLATWETEEAFA